LLDKRVHYSLFAIFFILGFLLIEFSVLNPAKEIDVGTMACMSSHLVYPHDNTTVEFEASVDPYRTCHMEMHEDYPNSLSNYIHYTFYKKSNPSQKRIEGWIRQEGKPGEITVDIPDSGVKLHKCIWI
jgi:hypothetical protein